MKPIHYLLILLVLIIAGLIYFQTENESEEVIKLEEGIKRREQAIHDWSRKYTASRTKMRQHSILFRDTITIKEKEIVSHKSNIKRLRSSPKVIEIVRENPVIDTIFSYYDSVGAAKDMIIYTLQKENNQL